MYCFASLVGSRLLVSLRDVREFAHLSEEEFAMLNGASTRVLGEMVAVGEVAKAQGPTRMALAGPSSPRLGQPSKTPGTPRVSGFPAKLPIPV